MKKPVKQKKSVKNPKTPTKSLPSLFNALLTKAVQPSQPKKGK